MSRYLGPRLRIVRRLGYLIGLTRKKPSTKLLNPDARRGIRKVIPPGQHGRSKSFKKKPYESNEYDFLIRLKLKQRIRYHYGITEKQLVNYVRQARKIKGSTGRVLLRLLEMRLDNTVFRLHMAPTIRAARQLINHGHIYVNNKKVSIPSYSCKPKDIITPAPKMRSIQLLNNFLTELDLEKSRFKNLLKILKFGKKGLLNNTKILNNNKEKSYKKNCKPNTIISLRIQRAGILEGQGIGFLGKNLVIVQPLFGNIKNYLGKSISVCIYLKRENKFYGYPTKPFNIKMRYSKLLNSIDAIQYFGRKKMQQNIQNKESANSYNSNDNDVKTIKNLNKSSSAIILMGGANIFRTKLSKKNQKFRQNSSDNILVKIEAASCGKNTKYVLNRKRQLSPFLLNKNRDTNPILFREKYLYSRKNRRFVGINHIFYVKMILKSVEQNPANIKNFYSLDQKKQKENMNLTSNSLQKNIFYSKFNIINQNNSKLKENIINTDVNIIISKKNYNASLLNHIISENSLKLRKHYLSKFNIHNLFFETKFSFIYWCIRKEKLEINLTKGKLQTPQSVLNLNKKILYIKQKLFKSLLSQIAIEKNLNLNYFWKAVCLFSKIYLKQNTSSRLNSIFNNFVKKKFLQTFCEMILDQQKDLSNKTNLFSIKAFLFFSKAFSLIVEWKRKKLINNSLFDKFINNIKESMSLIIVLQKSFISILKNKKQHSSFNINSHLILEYYKNQEFKILNNFKTQIQSKIKIHKLEKLSFNKITKINQFHKILELNSIKQELHFYQSLLCNEKIFHSNISYNIDILNNCNNYLNNKKSINTFFIYCNSFQNRKNLMKKQFSKYRFELQKFINLFKKTTLFSISNFDDFLNKFKRTEEKIKENLIQKQILQKLNLIKIKFDLKRFVLSNFLNKLKNSNLISDDQNQHILFKINYYLNESKYKKYKNLFSKIIKNNTLINQYLLNKLRNYIFNEKIVQKLFSQKLGYIQKLQEIENLDLIFHLTKTQLINSINNRINILAKLNNFESNFLVTKKLLSNNVKKKILNENFITINKNIYITKLNYFLNSNIESSSQLSSLNYQQILQKIQQQKIQQQIKQKKVFLSVSKKYENHFIKNLPIFNIDQNGKYLINYISQLFDLKEKQFFQKLDQTSITFYPTELNKKLVKQKIIQMNSSWLNYIVIFKKIDKLYQDNDLTKNEYSILFNQTKQFIIKQLILNKNKLLIGYNDYLKLGQNNVNSFINQIKNHYNILNIVNDFKFFKFSFIQINQKYNQLFNLLRNKEKSFLNQSIKNSLYFNKLRKINLFNDFNFILTDSELSQEILNKETNNFQNVYNNILKYTKVKSKQLDQKLSSNIIMKLSINIEKWVDNISIMKLKKGLNFLQKQQLITKPNFKLLISILLKFKQDAKKLTDNMLIFDSVLFFKVNKIYQQKRIQSFINLLINLNFSINYIKLNSELNYPININLQNQLNKNLYFQYYNQIICNQQINEIIQKFIFQFNNKSQILKYFKIFNSFKKKQLQTLIEKKVNEIIQLNNLNNSIDQTSYKTNKFINKTIKFCNLFIYYHLKYSKKINKYYLLNDPIQKEYNETNYLKNELLTKLYSKFSILKQQSLLTSSKYQILLDLLNEQQLTKQFIFNLFNEVNLAKLEQLIEYKFIHSNFIFYSKMKFFKFLTNLTILKERYKMKQNKMNKFLNKIRIQLNQKFQNEFQYILFVSKFNTFKQNGIITNQQKDQIEKQLINIINNIKNFSKRSIKLQERLKYGFINYRKYETITLNLIKNLQFKIQKIINNSFIQNEQIKNNSILNFNNFKNLRLNTSIKKVDLLQDICWENLQRLMYFALNISKGTFLDKKNFECDFLVLNYFKKELQFIHILNICKQIEKNSNYLKDLKNQTKTKIISQTRKFSGNLTKNYSKTKILKNNEKAFNQNKINAISLIQNKKTKNKTNILQTCKIFMIKQFLSKMKNILYHNFNQNGSIKISNHRLRLIENLYIDVENIKKNQINSFEPNLLRTNTINNYLNKLQVSLTLSTLNNFYSKKHAFKIYQNTTNYNKKLYDSKILSTYTEFNLLNSKIEKLSKLLQKSYKSKILLDIKNKNNKLLNMIRLQNFESYGLYSLKNKKQQLNKQVQEMYKKLENILINSNYSNASLIHQYLQFELNLLKKSQANQELNKYLTKSISFISNKLNSFENQSIIYSQKTYKQIKNMVLKTLLSLILIYPNLDNLKNLIKNNLISQKIYKKIKKLFYRKKLIAKLQKFLSKLKQNSFNDIYQFKGIFPKIILIFDKLNDLKVFNLISNNQYKFLQTQIQQILKYEQYITRLVIIKKQGILTDLQYNQILLKIQQKIVQKVREQKIVQKFKQYIEYLHQTKINNQFSKNKKNNLESLNTKYQKIISLNQGRWALVAIKEFYQQNLLTNSQYNEIIQKIEKNIRKKIQIAKLFSTNRYFSQLKLSNNLIQWGYTRRQNKKKSKLVRSLPNIWTKNILKELRKQSVISNYTYSEIEKQLFDNYYLKTKKFTISFLNESSKEKSIKKVNRSKNQTKNNSKLLKKSIESLLNYKRQIIYWLSIIETTPMNSDYLFDLSHINTLKVSGNISQKEYNKLKVYYKLTTNRLFRLKILQKSQSLNNIQYEKIYQKIIKSYLTIQYQYIQRLLRNKQSILQEVNYVNNKNRRIKTEKTIKKHLNKIKISKKLVKTSNSLYSLIQEVLTQLPISVTNKAQSTYRQRIIYNRLYSKLRSDEVLIKKWKQTLTKILKKQLTPPLDIPPHLELKRIQISIISTNITKKSKKSLIIPVGTVNSAPSRKTVGVSVLERLIVEYYSRN